MCTRKIKDILNNEQFREITIVLLFSYILSATAIAIIIWGGAAFEDIIELWLFYFPPALVVFTPAYITIYLLCKKVKQTFCRFLKLQFSGWKC